MRVLAAVDLIRNAAGDFEPAAPGQFLKLDVPANLSTPGQEIEVVVRVRVQSVLGA